MNSKETMRNHQQSHTQGKKLRSLAAENCVKQAESKTSAGTRSLHVEMDQSRTKRLTHGGEKTVKMHEKLTTTTNEWKSSASSRPAGVRTTRQIRRNERERGRKARLNAAFQVLRSVVPSTVNSSGTVTERKMTQVEILRLAKNYISNLTELLKQDSNTYTLRSFNV
ncbi:protein dimmed-like [Acropora muricata]|uniref:protein dimmed-like n=1 Tax=Acropora millepora TaxID=45264 RepID=UPI001CF1BAD1|nr:protein dimmed-like [Acropora millepora]XP_029208914.2 protein dimmed-like [Acropora millepora]